MKKTSIEDLGILIHDTGRLMRKNFEKRGQAYGLSSAQWRLLVRVVREQKPTQAHGSSVAPMRPTAG